MIDNFREIEEFFEELEEYIEVKVDIYVIGGAALMKRGIKAATKDVDAIVSTKLEFIKLQEALKKAGFEDKIPGKEYSRMNLSQIFERGELRLDLFENEVCGKFSLTENMRKRAEKALSLEKINIYLCSNEDIFLFKTMTEREGDITDCINIATTQAPNWKTIISELKNQIKNSKQDVWITWVGERFDILEERGLDMPIMSELNKLRDKFFDDLEARLDN